MIKRSLSPWGVGALFVLLFLQALGCHQETPDRYPRAARLARAGFHDDSEAIVVLRSDTIAEMQRAMATVHAFGGNVTQAIANSVLFAQVSPSVKPQLLQADENIVAVEHGEMEPHHYRRYGKSVAVGIQAWNHYLREKNKKPALPPAQDLSEPFHDDLIIPSDLPKTRQEKEKREKEYLKQWERNKKELQRKYKVGSSETEAITPTAFGQGYGAGFYDTSLYMSGLVAVGVFFAGAGWTDPQMDSAMAEISTGLRLFSELEPSARLAFIIVDERLTPLPSISDWWTYANNLRNIHLSHWAYFIEMRTGTGTSSAALFGPWTRVFQDALPDGRVLRHETGHIFGAIDQYTNYSPVERWGYLNSVNANSRANDGRGFFGGAGEGLSDLMLDLGPIGVYTRAQIGLRDRDGDGLPDPLDTVPNTKILNRTGSYQLVYYGRAEDLPLLNEYSAYPIYSSVTINTILDVEWRVNGGGWSQALALDGFFDGSVEDFGFGLPPLPDGTYTVEIRAINVVGNIETSYARDVVTITDSPVVNARPFPSFTVMPSVGSVGTIFTLDASATTDLESPASTLLVRWDFEGDGVWDTPFSANKVQTVQYPTYDFKTIVLEVVDPQGNDQQTTRDLFVFLGDLSPIASLVVQPESEHGTGKKTLDVTLDASATFDPELGPLQFRWDFENDDVWDTLPSSQAQVQHSYPLVRPGLLGVYDTPHSAQRVYVVGSTAYVADGLSGLQIVDVTNPSNPVFIGSHDTPGWAYDVFVSGTVAYVADGSSGLQILDVSNSSSPSFLGNYAFNGEALRVFVSGTTAFVVGGNLGGLLMVDVSVPTQPALLGTYRPGASQIRTGFLVGTTAYLGNANVLEIVDVSNPANPLLIGSLLTAGVFSNLHVVGTLTYLAGFPFQIVDVADPTNPVLLSTFSGNVRDVWVAGSTAYIGHAFQGLQVIDVSDPLNPVAKSNLYSSFANGLWISGTIAYVAATSPGLEIRDVGDLEIVQQTHAREIKMEVTDAGGNYWRSVRNAWSNTYNHLPVLNPFTIAYEPVAEATFLGSFLNSSFNKRLFVSGNTAYLADNSPQLQIIDVSDPSNPILLSAPALPAPGVARGVFVSGNIAYVAAEQAGLVIYDVTDPVQPIFLSRIGPPQSLPNFAIDVHVSASIAYITNGGDGLVTVDVGNPGAPAYLGKLDTPGAALSVDVAGDVAYVADQMNGLYVIDVSNPLLPFPIGGYNTPDTAQDVQLSGNFAYLADGLSGLLIFDVTNPASLLLVNSVDTPGTAQDVFVSGTRAAVADEQFGLQIIDVTNPNNPASLGSVATAGNARAVQLVGTKAYVGDAFGGNSGLQIFDLLFGNGVVAKQTTAQDPDFNTTWDGLLEFRWDVDSDGSYDTHFSAQNLDRFVTFDRRNDLPITLEVRDRFFATDQETRVFHTPRFVPAIEGKEIFVTGGKGFDYAVWAQDVDGESVTLTAVLANGDPLDSIGATFVDLENGKGVLSWITNKEQIGLEVTITFTASDGILLHSENFEVKVLKPGGGNGEKKKK
ncbi:MAG TPA: hypothetical protein VI895_02005 [Bdellovibrionota bacterium]|nr:hypothetical protein [Bdellovibrionota bacterium]